MDCIACGSRAQDATRSYHLDRPSKHDLGGRKLLVCPKCGLGFLFPQPTDEFLNKEIYNESYPLYDTQWTEASASFRRQAYRSLFPHPLLGLIPKNPGKALDVGCASGYWMHELKKLGWDVSGLDISEDAIEAIRSLGFEGSLGSIEKTKLENESFDLILLSAVLEHLHDPVAALRNSWAALRPGGFVVIDVPNLGSVETNIFKENWSFFAVGHLFYFTEDSLRRMLSESHFAPEVFVRKSSELTTGYSFARRLRVPWGMPPFMLGTGLQLFLNLVDQSGELFCRARKTQ